MPGNELGAKAPTNPRPEWEWLGQSGGHHKTWVTRVCLEEPERGRCGDEYL